MLKVLRELQSISQNLPKNASEAYDIQKLACKNGNDVHSIAYKACYIFTNTLVRIIKLAIHFQIKVCPVGFTPTPT